MPVSPPRPCRRVGCKALIKVGAYCVEHKKAEHKRIDRDRASSTQRGYGHHWRTRVRVFALANEPLCRHCAERDVIRLATDVDHIDGNSRNNAAENLRPLCHSCHSARTARDQGFGRKGKPSRDDA
jgi:5-methylcytosine-specific restriction protein A